MLLAYEHDIVDIKIGGNCFFIHPSTTQTNRTIAHTHKQTKNDKCNKVYSVNDEIRYNNACNKYPITKAPSAKGKKWNENESTANNNEEIIVISCNDNNNDYKTVMGETIKAKKQS